MLTARPWLLVAGATALIVAVRAWLAAHIGLTDDEAYYRLWSLAPALSYLDHPPMVGWWIAAGRALAGDDAFAIRLPLLAAFVVGTAAFWRATALLFGQRLALTSTGLMLAMPLLGAGGVIITPDAPTVLCWGLVLWAIAELIRSQNANWWLAVGLFAGVGLLSKYTNLFVGAGILLWLVVAPVQRRWFATWQLWTGGALAAACAVPVLHWNATHGWASFAKQFGRVARGADYGVAYVLELLGGFVALASPATALLAIAGLYLMTRAAVQRRNGHEALVVALTGPALVYFLAHALHARVQANWLAPLYPLLAIAAAYALDRLVARRWQTPVFLVSAGLGIGITTVLYVNALTPLAREFVRMDPMDQLRGWQGLGDDIERVRAQTGARWIATSSYATTGQLAFALRARGVPVAQLTERIRYVHLPEPAADIVSAPALYVELARRQAPALLEHRFARVVRLADLQRRHGETVLATYAVYLVAEAKGDPLQATATGPPPSMASR